MSGPSLETASALASRYEAVVIGAGPAGLTAAARLAEGGASTLLLDENPAPGGQIYRSIEAAGAGDLRRLGPDYAHGRAVAERFRASGAAYAPRATVWDVGPATGPVAGGAADRASTSNRLVSLTLGGAGRAIEAGHVILATGAIERPMPFPGWTLPGVMTAGAAQIALKTAGLVPTGRVIVAGCGPLLYLLTSQLLDAGAEIAAVLDTTPRGNWLRAAPHAPGFLASAYMGKGLKLLRTVRTRTRVIGGVTALATEGTGALRAVRYGTGSGKGALEADLLLVHQGVVPNANFSNAIGCAHHFDEAQRAFVPDLDDWFASSLDGVSIPGDGGGIAGAAAAEVSGEIAALGALRRLGRLGEAPAMEAALPLRRRWKSLQRGRAFLDRLYAPSPAFLAPPDDDTIVCRCEEVRAGAVREAIGLGVAGPNQLKTFLRCGMGPCQGRFCAGTVTEMIAAGRGESPAAVGTYRLRAPVKPVRLSELASFPETPEAVLAVTGSHSTDRIEPLSTGDMQ
ncbi:NAD(P)/FAD-dependent oxidoreductase [Mangrovicella endophytica]|uniref:NAD(P)/FAD-dependent oxidoreductase n=1 Tax=Mangrovicella endophytica TaxID=2066697 RepID=UPI000C9E2C71|nr:NAD(P)/FAD-dependent oxidoreductase [Mangrovicella endophytica]